MSPANKVPKVLEELLSKSRILVDLIDYSPKDIAVAKILENKAGSIILYAMDNKQHFTEHKHNQYQFIQILEGTARIIIAGKGSDIEKARTIIVPPNTQHSIQAIKKTKMLITLIKS